MNGMLLQLKNIAVGYDGHPLYGGVNAGVGAGQLVTLIGGNGAGKSTLLRCITGRLHPMEGCVEICGRPLTELSQRELARLVSIVNTGQTHAGALTVLQLVALGRQPHTGFWGRLSEKDMALAGDALEAVGMLGYASRRVASLSDGERQKVMIARALAQDTPVMVLDEPTAFLDVASRIEITRLLAGMAHERGRAIVLSTHDISTSLRLSDQLWLIADQGDGSGERRLIAGPTRQLVDNGCMDRLFPDRKVRFDTDVMDFLPAD